MVRLQLVVHKAVVCSGDGATASGRDVLTAAACGGSSDSASSETTKADNAAEGAASTGSGPGAGSKKVGFIFVGPKDDYGYNQAAYAGSQAVKKAFPDMEVLTAENVPEDDNATRVMEKMIADGAKIIFATSYGHLDPGLKVAEAHPDVAVVSQGDINLSVPHKSMNPAREKNGQLEINLAVGTIRQVEVGF